VVVRLNSNGQTSRQTRTERCAFLSSLFIAYTLPIPCRTILVIASMPPQAGGRKIKTFIGTTAEQRPQPTSVRRKFVKSRKQRQRHSPLHCMIRSFSILPLPGFLMAIMQRFWTVQEGIIIIKYTRNGYKCNPDPSSLGGDQYTC
jgi:hypothetical protein